MNDRFYFFVLRFILWFLSAGDTNHQIVFLSKQPMFMINVLWLLNNIL